MVLYLLAKVYNGHNGYVLSYTVRNDIVANPTEFSNMLAKLT